MIGVAAEGPGRSATQFTFSVFEKMLGRPFSVVEPLKNGPRHWDQFSARAEWPGEVIRPPSAQIRTNNFLRGFMIVSCARRAFRMLIQVIRAQAYNRPTGG